MHNNRITLGALGFTCDVTKFCHIWSVLLTIFYFYFLFWLRFRRKCDKICDKSSYPLRE